MIKRTYLAILSIAVVSVLLGSLFYNSVTFAVRAPTQVEVINLPTDEQGNLKVSEVVTSKVVTVVKNLNLSWTGGDVFHRGKSEHFTVDVDGYNEVCVYASFRNWTTSTEHGVDVKFVVDEIGAPIPVSSDTEAIKGSTPTTYTSPRTYSALYHVRGAELGLSVYGKAYSPYPAGWVLVSVSLYLRN